MLLPQSAYLDQNMNRAGYPGQMHWELKIQHGEAMYVNIHIQQANLRFGSVELRKCYLMGRVVFQAEVVSLLESAVWVGWAKVHLFLCVSSVSADVCGAILANKASSRVVLRKHSRVSISRSLLHFMPRKLNTPHCQFSDLAARFIDQILCFIYYSMRNHAFR